MLLHGESHAQPSSTGLRLGIKVLHVLQVCNRHDWDCAS